MCQKSRRLETLVTLSPRILKPRKNWGWRTQQQIWKDQEHHSARLSQVTPPWRLLQKCWTQVRKRKPSSPAWSPRWAPPMAGGVLFAGRWSTIKWVTGHETYFSGRCFQQRQRLRNTWVSAMWWGTLPENQSSEQSAVKKAFKIICVDFKSPCL